MKSTGFNLLNYRSFRFIQLFSFEENMTRPICSPRSLKLFSSKTTGPMSTCIEHPRVKGIHFLSSDGLCPRGGNNLMTEIHLRNLIFFSRTMGPISTKSDTKHPCETGILTIKDHSIIKMRYRGYSIF